MSLRDELDKLVTSWSQRFDWRKAREDIIRSELQSYVKKVEDSLAKTQSESWVISKPFGGERLFLRWFEMSSERNEGQPDSGWSTNVLKALRMSNVEAHGLISLLNSTEKVTIDFIKPLLETSEAIDSIT
jgi:hypothetical protein